MEHGTRARTLGRLLAFAVPVVIIGTLFSTQDEARPPPSVAEDAPDAFADKVRMTEFDERGSVLFAMEAVRLEYFEAMQSTLLTSPSMTIHNEDAPPWHVVAQRGTIESDEGAKNNVVTLETNVVLHQERAGDGFMVITTDRLTVYPERRYAMTNQGVIIKTESTISQGVGLEVDLAENRFTLSSDPDDRGSIIIQP